jgi:dsDNA-binding SOS-regulon protein
MTELTQVFKVGDRFFDTKAEAEAFVRRPKIVDALRATVGTGEQADRLIDWLVENQEAVEGAFDVGTIKRVTKSELKKIEKDVEAAPAFLETPEGKAFAKAMPFMAENLVVAFEGFRWPAVKRMDDAAKAAEMVRVLTEASENEKLAAYIVENREAITEAYKAAKPTRPVSPNATNALAEYRAKQAAEKAAREAAAAESAEA